MSEWVGKERRERGSQRTCDARLTYCHHDNRHHFTGAALRMPVWAEVTELKVGISLLWVPQRTDPLLQCSPHLLFFFFLPDSLYSTAKRHPVAPDSYLWGPLSDLYFMCAKVGPASLA